MSVFQSIIIENIKYSKEVILRKSVNMAEELQKAHLFYDDINKIRVLEASVLKETEDLKDTCKEYESSKIIRYSHVA